MKAESPEDRLLRLIKGKYKTDKGKNAPPPQVSKKPKQDTPVTRMKDLFLKVGFLKPSFLRAINKGFIVILVILLGYIFYLLIFPADNNLEQLLEEQGIQTRYPKERSGGDISQPVSTEYTKYAKEISGRKLFSNSFVKERSNAQPAGPDISQKFSLVGIIAGDAPQAIIEDLETKKTYYLYSGQSFGEATVEDIGEGKVILLYKGKQIILVL